MAAKMVQQGKLARIGAHKGFCIPFGEIGFTGYCGQQ
jgi:hypothetical protein